MYNYIASSCVILTWASCRSEYAREKCLLPSTCLASDEGTTINDIAISSSKQEELTQNDPVYTCTVSTHTDQDLLVLDISQTDWNEKVNFDLCIENVRVEIVQNQLFGTLEVRRTTINFGA
ncbi:hypothetical protein CHS0354_013354 [Potamilus streckersoni]|uniref:Uncharacterized protein n=1 Tax=Potamilus streckersoni TaxID=2493646 RepID=A0AAE0W6M6_9BIVA|nr:hypothetical protein CHS0354_013354 [Potamilus streckersoni]